MQLLLGITPLSEIPEPYSLPELGKRSGVFILHQLMPLFTISCRVISDNPLAQRSSQRFVNYPIGTLEYALPLSEAVRGEGRDRNL